MLTELQQRKLAHTFKLWDANRDGVVEQIDYELLIERVAAVRGWAPGSAAYQGLQQMYLGSWEAIRAYADTNRDNRITLDEWMACFGDWLRDPAAFRQMITPMSEQVFGLLDAD